MLSLRTYRAALYCAVLPLAAAGADDLPPGAVARLGTPVQQAQFSLPSVAFAPDGGTLAWASSAAGQEGYQLRVHLWDVKQNRAAGKLEIDGMASSPLRFSADGRYVAVGIGNSTGGPDRVSVRSHERVQVWDVKTGKDLERFGTYTQRGYHPIRAVTFTPDGKSVLSTRKQHLQTWDFATGDVKAEKEFTTITVGGWLSERFSPDRQTFVMSWVRVTFDETTDGPLVLWDLTGKKEPRKLKVGGLPHGFSPDGKLLAVRTAEKKLVVWDLAADRQVVAFDADVVTNAAEGAAFSTDSKRIAYFDRTRTVRIGDVTTGKVLATLPRQAEAVAFAPDGKTLVTVSADGTALLWDVARLLKAE